MSTALTKKQQKAQAFRSKQKSKKGGKEDVIPQDVPEQDLIEGQDETVEDEAVIAEPSNKRKREEEVKDVKGKGKAKTAWDEDGEEKKKSKKEIKKEIKQRFILFVGNLGYKVGQEEIAAHFTEAAGEKPSVRLLTNKPTTKSEPPKSRGIAFLELSTSTAMQACLKLHHSTLDRRRINVELTAGGGGKSDARSAKIKERNDRVGGQRERRAVKEREAAIADGTLPPTVEVAGGNEDEGRKRRRKNDSTAENVKPVEAKPQVVREDGETVGPDGEVVKIRGGRRVKVKPTAQGANGRFSGGYGGHGGNDRRRDGPNSRPQQPFRPKWQPTGANALNVG